MAEQLHPEDIYQTLEYEIVTLKIKPGETISENQLCKRFGISRTPVRAALQRLEQNGFVQIIPCKGTIVTPIDLDIVDQIVYQRTAVESTVLRDFIQVCSPKEYIEIKHKYDLLEEMAQTMTDPDNVDINAFLTLDLEMHAIWFCSMNKWYIWQNLTKPQPDYSRFTRLDVVRANNVPDVLSEHGGVHIAALEVGQLMHGRCSLLVVGSRAGQGDQDLVGVQAGVLAAQIVGLEGLDGLNGKPH